MAARTVGVTEMAAMRSAAESSPDLGTLRVRDIGWAVWRRKGRFSFCQSEHSPSDAAGDPRDRDAKVVKEHSSWTGMRVNGGRGGIGTVSETRGRKRTGTGQGVLRQQRVSVNRAQTSAILTFL